MAVSSVVIPVRIIVVVVQLNVAVIISSSPKRLSVGGKAMFMRLASSHQVAIIGSITCSPWVSSNVRVCVCS